MPKPRGPRPHGGAGHEYDKFGFCSLCDEANRRRQMEYRERQRAKGLRLLHGYWSDPYPDLTARQQNGPSAES